MAGHITNDHQAVYTSADNLDQSMAHYRSKLAQLESHAMSGGAATGIRGQAQMALGQATARLHDNGRNLETRTQGITESMRLGANEAMNVSEEAHGALASIEGPTV